MCNLAALGAGTAEDKTNINLLRGDLQGLVPDHPACREALQLAQQSLPPSIFNHSLRVFLYAQAFALADDDGDDDTVAADIGANPALSAAVAPAPMAPHVLFVACILHDIGAAEAHDAAPPRFEVVGADAAADVLRRHGVDAQGAREAWLAVALHTSPHVAERLGGLARAVRLGVRADFGSYPPPPTALGSPSLNGDADVGDVVARLPRLEIEKELGDAVVRQVLQRRDKAPGGSWPGDLLRGWEAYPDWDGVNKEF